MWFKQKKESLINALAYLLQQAFLQTAGSWGPIIIDENGNIVEDSENTYESR